MTVFDLKLNDTVVINGYEYGYKGVQKVKLPNFGRVEQIVFERTVFQTGGKEIKYFDLKVGSQELRNKNGIITL